MSWHAAHLSHVRRTRRRWQGAQRYAPLNSQPDNANLDKALAVCQADQEKYGNALSAGPTFWSFAGNVALESPCGHIWFRVRPARTSGSRRRPCGAEDTWLGTDCRYSQSRENEFDNPFGHHHDGPDLRESRRPRGQSDPLPWQLAIFARRSGRMAMNDEETAALIVGGHTFGKTHGAVKPITSVTSPKGPR